jgi:eukaryotic-like serine/threonine-protein kinase
MRQSLPAPQPEDATGAASALGAEPIESRYVQERLLGQGAMGAVYLVRDRETGDQLALKKLFRMDGKSVLRLKREFRSLADLSHPNLVKVYELGRAEDGWFLTMEYVDGVDLQTHLGLGEANTAVSGIAAAIAQATSRSAWLKHSVLPAFHQLATGVRALHRAGMLHRDLKPSNVIVAKERVVVPDFGLVRELDANAPALTEDGAIAGTPAYMAPEQALGKALTEASDWYAFGAMLYEALTGELPFDGPVFKLMQDKLERDPKPPSSIAPEVPVGLSELCMALLARDPAARPKSAEVLARLGAAPSVSAPVAAPAPGGDTSLMTETQTQSAAPFFGRKQELAALWDALNDSFDGSTKVLHVRGISGSGKSALVEHFLGEVERPMQSGQGEALVLRSRCYEREAMPFKALDGVIDALGRHLGRLDDIEVSNLLPTNVGALAQLFPVLERLRAVQRLLSVSKPAGDAVHSRQRAELALRELFVRLGTHRPIVIWIDDLQWGDLDSAGILKGWLQRAADLPLLLVLSYRSDEAETSECLRLLLGAEGLAGISRTVQLATLEPADIRALCESQLGSATAGGRHLVERIVSEAQGSPFLAAQLAAVAGAKLSRGDADVGAVSIRDLITQTQALLPDEAPALLRVLALAGRPIAPKLALRAAGVRRGGRELVHALRRLQLVRTRDAAGERLLEVYHDQVREGVQRLLGPEESAQVHASLLAALEYSGRADPDWLHAHAMGANNPIAAFRYGLVAAERAMATFAFERAAELYTRCLELRDDAAEGRGELMRKLAEAFGCCGRGGKAADAYLEASRLATGEDGVTLMRLASSHLFRSGRFEQAEAMLQRVLAAMSLRVPTTKLGLIAALVWERLRGAFRGFRFTPRSEAEIPAVLLARIDTFNAMRVETQTIDALRAALFLLRGARWALDAGEPLRILEALSGLCYVEARGGSSATERRTDRLLARTAELAEKIGTPAARATLCTTQALAAFSLGRPDLVLAPSYEAERLYRSQEGSRLDGSYFPRLSVVAARIGALYERADYRVFASELQAALDEAQATENVTAQLQFAFNATLLEELSGRSEDSIERLDRQRELLPARGFTLYHALHMIAVCHAACGTGEYAWGRRYLDLDWPRFLRSAMARSNYLAYLARSARARLLFNQHLLVRGAVDRRQIDAEITALERSHRGGRGMASANVQRARLAHLEGDSARAVELMQRSIERCSPTDVERTRFGMGLMLAGEQGAALCEQSVSALREAGAIDPHSYLRGYYPELMAGSTWR